MKIYQHRQPILTPSIAIVIRTKNRPRLLTRCLKSLAEQKRLPDEVIVVNDGGITVESVIKQFNSLNIQLINHEINLGRACAGNVGVNASHCDLIGFLDDDDRYFPDHLLRLDKAFQLFDVKVAYSGCRVIRRDLLGDKVVLQEKIYSYFNDPFDAQRLQYENYIPLINLLIDRELWVAAGGFDEAFDAFEDWDLLIRLSQKTPFYHLSAITTEYSVWGSTQITQTTDKSMWKASYAQVLEKHVLNLPYQEKLDFLVNYWIVSQERRAIIQTQHAEVQALHSELANKELNWSHTQQSLQQDIAVLKNHNVALQAEISNLKSEHAHLYQVLSEKEGHYQQIVTNAEQQHRLMVKDTEASYQAILQQAKEGYQTTLHSLEQVNKGLAEQLVVFKKQIDCEQERHRSLSQIIHELSKQIALGMSRAAMIQTLASHPTAYSLSKSTDGVIDDYYRLTEWIRDKTQRLSLVDQEWEEKIYLFQSSYAQLNQQLSQLIDLISASHWPQIRRYAGLLGAIAQQSDNTFQSMNDWAMAHRHLNLHLGFAPLLMKVEDTSPLPPARPLSNVYPTFTTIAGTPEQPQMMENVVELGTIPFLLDANETLTFLTHCTVNYFFRLDILLATRLRINLCHVRFIIRELPHYEILRVVYINALNIFDNRYQTIEFEAIPNSAGKTYHIEIDSPNANEHAGIAVWCHSKQPKTRYAPTLPDDIAAHSPQLLPQWVKQGILNLPLRLSQVKNPPHVFFISGISSTTTALQLHLFLTRISEALIQAQTDGEVVISGEGNQELVNYFKRNRLSILPPFDLVEFLCWCQSQDSDYVWNCNLAALPQVDFVTRGLEVFKEWTNTAVLVPMEKHGNGLIRCAYSAMMRDGVINSIATGVAADHPYHNYRRVVEATNSQLLTFKPQYLSQLNFDQLKQYHTDDYRLADMIQQLKCYSFSSEGTKKGLAVYDAAVCYVHDQLLPPNNSELYEKDRHQFYTHWQDKLLQYTALHSDFSIQLNPLQQPTVLIIDATLPMFDEDAGSVRLYTLLKIWVSLGYRLTFLSDNLDSQFKYRHALEALGVEVYHGRYGVQDAFAYRQFDYAVVCRVEVGHRYIPIIRLLSPKTIIFYDTVDIHYIREQRQAEIENNQEIAERASDTKRKELSNCLLANRVITVTNEDGYHLQKEIPHLGFSVIPVIYLPPAQKEKDLSFAQRDGLVFIGNYNHHPNEDAVYYFIEHVLPKIHKQLPDVKFYVIGSHMKEKMKALASEQVRVIGWVDKVEPEFAQRRVFVSYLRYGAGMKGKLGQALSLGLPIVTTSIGAEGMGLKEGETALIADDPDNFAKSVCCLYQDEMLWNKLSRRGKEYIDQQCGEVAVREKLKGLLQLFPYTR